MPKLRRGPIALLLSVCFALVSLVALAPSATAADTDIKINEVVTNGGATDWIELLNTGATDVDLSGMQLRDNDDTHIYTIAAGTNLAAGAYVALDVDVDGQPQGDFGLGSADSARLFSVGGAALLDTQSWTAHSNPSYGVCPTAPAWRMNTTATKAAANDCSSPVRINEIESDDAGGDWFELINPSAAAASVGGFVLRDNGTSNDVTIPGGTTIAAGGYLAVDMSGIGSSDQARLFDGATLVDSHTWTAHAATTYGRCPNGTGAFTTTTAPTKGAANDCGIVGLTSIKINEVDSTPTDFIELTNVGATTIDISGWRLKDDDDTRTDAVPASTTLAPGAYYSFVPTFGIGNGDMARVFAPDGTTLADSYTFGAHAAQSWGRCPDGTGAFVDTSAPTPGAANACAPAGPPDVVVNEVESNGDAVGDWVELKNRSGSPVDISGWKILDNDPGHVSIPVVVPASTSIPAGGYYAIYTEFGQSPGWGLGVGDSVTVYLPDGTTQVDTTTWGAHPTTTWGRCPDGSGSFRETTVSTRGLTNACSPIRINEIESSGGTPGDWVELTNISNSAVDVSGYVVKDNVDADVYTIPASTTIASKGYLVIDESSLGYGLGSSDSVRLYGADGTTLIEQYVWTAHSAQSYARCNDGVGDFKDAKTPTKGATNSCPGLATTPWPGGQTITTADQAGTFVQDLSGLVFDPADPDVLWAAQNKLGTLFKLTRDSHDDFVPAAGWPKNPVYADGTGAPDTEGLTIGPDGFVYLASERNNAASGVSRMSILRYDPAAAGSTIAATDEWDLTSQIPPAGANLGLEGVAFVPDTYLTTYGFTDQNTGQRYSPSTYPDHGTGLYVVAVEATGDLIAFALDSDGTTSHKVATIDSGFDNIADVVFDPERQRLWAVTDDTSYGGQTAQLKIDGAGVFVVDTAFDRPAGMPNINNEGLAIAPQSRCVNGKKEVLWSDDGDTGGHSIRRGTIDCTVPATPPPALTPQTITFTSSPPAAPVVGDSWAVTTQGGGSGNPVTLSASGCSLSGTTVTFDRAGTCTVSAKQAGSSWYAEGSASRSVTVSALVAPTITAVVSPSRPASGWWTGPVTVRFTCTAGTGAVSCPEPVTLTGDGADQEVSRTATATDGETASVRVGDIDIDSTGPNVAIRGGSPAKARCVASDALSGLDSCTLTKSRKGKKVTVVARAVDLAGNVSTDRATFKVRRG